MKTIRLAVILDQHISSGGGYQQALNAALLTKRLPRATAETVYFTNIKSNIETLAIHGIDLNLLEFTFYDKALNWIRRRTLSPFFIKLIKRIERYSPFEKRMIGKAIDLVYFLSPSHLARDLESINYMVTVWDLCHRDDPEFPEVRMNREFEKRESYYQNILCRSVAVIVDSDLSKKNVMRHYSVDKERIIIIPFQPAVSTRADFSSYQKGLNIKEKYDICLPYVYYPAQYWAHKNHVYIIEGLIALKQRHGIDIAAIFSGGDQGNVNYLKRFVQKNGMEDRVRFIGFVSNEEIPVLYKQSLALVMPTYFGPTNLPPLEAFQLGTPVLYSDKEGLREQVGQSALLLDLSDPNSMADQINRLICEDGLRDKLVLSGYAHLSFLDSFDRLSVLRSIIERFSCKRICWD